MNRYYAAIVVLLAATSSLFAQEEQIDTDRPSITETTSTVPKGKFQAEAGFMHQQESRDEYSLSVPTVLWKFGLLNNMELRLTTEIASEKTGGDITTGLQPVTAGIKLKLWKEKGILPEASIMPQIAINKIASEEFQEEHPAPEVKLIFKNTISNNIDLGYNVGAEWDGDTGIPTYQYTFSPNFKLNDRFRTFVEAFGYLPQQQHPDHWVDAGLLFLISKNIQIDLAGGYELSAHSHYHAFFETVGFSLRI